MARPIKYQSTLEEPLFSRRRLRPLVILSAVPVLLISLAVAWYFNQDFMRQSFSDKVVSTMASVSSYRASGLDITSDSSGTKEVREQFSYVAPSSIRSRYRTTLRSSGGGAVALGDNLTPQECGDTEVIMIGSTRYQRCNDKGPGATWQVLTVDSSMFGTVRFQPWQRLGWCTDIAEEDEQTINNVATRVLSCTVPNEREAAAFLGTESTPARERFVNEASIQITVWVREKDDLIARFAMKKTAPGRGGTTTQTLDYAYMDFGEVAAIEPPTSSAVSSAPDVGSGQTSRPSAPDTGPRQTPRPSSESGEDTIPRLAIINGQSFHLEVADDDYSRSKGLSNRHSLLPDDAMLFIFPEEGLHRFWMEDMLLPLDILFLDRNRIIVDIQTMELEPGVPKEELTIYQPRAPALYALEMNAGLAEKHGFEVGMQVELE